jgi:hypothetical protein
MTVRYQVFAVIGCKSPQPQTRRQKHKSPPRENRRALGWVSVIPEGVFLAENETGLRTAEVKTMIVGAGPKKRKTFVSITIGIPESVCARISDIFAGSTDVKAVRSPQTASN